MRNPFPIVPDAQEHERQHSQCQMHKITPAVYPMMLHIIKFVKLLLICTMSVPSERHLAGLSTNNSALISEVCYCRVGRQK